MARYDFDKPRLYLDANLESGADIPASREHVNYLRNVLRLGTGAQVLVFNGRDGEWLAELVVQGRKSMHLQVAGQVRPQTAANNLVFMFAPLKHARLDYMVQKAVEMGAGRLRPVITRRTQATRINLDRMRANVIEAAEQCGILTLPGVEEPQIFDALVRDWPEDRPLIHCDEDAPPGDPIEVLRALPGDKSPSRPLAVIVGPEGGFSPEEREKLAAMKQAVTISLGPRILRADTAATAALAIVQAAAGDW